AEKLRLKFDAENNIYVINDSAENLIEILKQIKIYSVDIILSSIPFSFLSKQVARKIAHDSYKTLKPGGRLAVFQMTPLALSALKPVFKQGVFTLLPFNIPPLWLWLAKK
ncbi:MAG: hypothetical protein WDZ73_01575, partial [Candidatus Paceibacterota bacterium]